MTTTKQSEAARRRQYAARRAAMIAALGMAPEPVNCPASERYCADNRDLRRYMVEDGRHAEVLAIYEAA